jgi:hypothetical protein
VKTAGRSAADNDGALGFSPDDQPSKKS